MLNSLLVTVSLLLGFWLVYLLGRRAGSERHVADPYADPSVYQPPRRMPTRPTTGGRPLPYAPPDPPWVTQHALGCQARPRAAKARLRVCGGCGSPLPHRHPTPPRSH